MGTAIDGITIAVKYATPTRAAVPTATPIFCFSLPFIAGAPIKSPAGALDEGTVPGELASLIARTTCQLIKYGVTRQ